MGQQFADNCFHYAPLAASLSRETLIYLAFPVYIPLNVLTAYLRGVNPDEEEKLHDYLNLLIALNHMKAFWKETEALLPDSEMGSFEEFISFTEELHASGKLSSLRKKQTREES